MYYRINVVKITLPNLDERKEDIPLLINHFIERFNKLKDKNITDITPEVLQVLMNYISRVIFVNWRNIIEHAFVLCRGSIIGTECLPESVRPATTMTPSQNMSLQDLEAAFLIAELKKNGWNQTRTAESLGIHKTTLWRKLKSSKLKNPNNSCISAIVIISNIALMQ